VPVLGAASRAEIEHEAGRDPQDPDGMLAAARCRAALPDAGAKRAAWAVLREGTLSGYELAATAEGFWQADQAELLAGYVPGYFAALPALDGGLARVWCRHGFPHYAAEAAAVQAGERCLEAGGITGSLRRLLADQLEDLRRALALRSAD
jgi:aminopeptidase N